jgi:hypothetical protein
MSRARHPWTPAEDNVLKAQAIRVPTPQLAEALGRGVYAVKLRCLKLGIARRPMKCGRPRSAA